ncbi:hypothetical protein [Risungbinella massiliensis]|uniref:hypothetical protein n=1 Tax=Risungbinella massiliensis TaxID=1329796 RepID=UPI0005CB9741|nr:hypothetical protein [Risungbinella massiliensis]
MREMKRFKIEVSLKKIIEVDFILKIEFETITGEKAKAIPRNKIDKKLKNLDKEREKLLAQLDKMDKKIIC